MSCTDHGLYSPDGYGRRKRRLLHRLVYAEAHGLDERRMGGAVLHSCDNPRCINVEHLSLGTQRDNVADMHAKGRASNQAGYANGNAKLTDEQVANLRSRYKAPGVESRYGNGAAMCIEFGIAKAHLSRIIRGIYR